MKLCPICKNTKLCKDFYLDNSRPDKCSTYCKECQNVVDKNRYWNNREKEIKRRIEHGKKRPDLKRAAHKRWKENNPEKYKEIYTRYNLKKRNNIFMKINDNISVLIRKSLERKKNGYRWEKIVGYTLNDFITHFENLFLPGMKWENHGQWHIDHIKPVSLFNFKSPFDNEFKECWSLENLQPLWEKDNLKKGSKFNGINHIYYESNFMS